MPVSLYKAKKTFEMNTVAPTAVDTPTFPTYLPRSRTLFRGTGDVSRVAGTRLTKPMQREGSTLRARWPD